MRILVTGCAGFIGFNLCLKLLKEKKYLILGIDNLNSYYDPKLKKKRLKILSTNNNFKFSKIDIANQKKLFNELKNKKIEVVVNLAAQAGVRYSITNPEAYFNSNLKGFFNILELSRVKKIQHLIFASTSSVYGDNKKFPTKESFNTDLPLSFYAATKKSNEVMAHSYSEIYKLKCTGLRFFTVYGPYGRPDMSLFKFTKAIFENKTIDLFNSGNHTRDFTFVDDIVESIKKIIENKKNNKKIYNIYKIGNGRPVNLKTLIKILEKFTGKQLKYRNLDIQKGDVIKTHADISKLIKEIDYEPQTKIEHGIKSFLDWYKGFYK
jgi:UDP-glucuronate 4-epimerase